MQITVSRILVSNLRDNAGISEEMIVITPTRGSRPRASSFD
jgi:hypothetical protein